MKFKINPKEWLQDLDTAIKVVPSNPTEAILACFLISLRQGKLFVRAANAELCVEISRAAESSEDGSAALDARTLVNLVRTIDDNEITIEKATDSPSATIRWSTGEATVPVFDETSFPEKIKVSIEKNEKLGLVRVKAEELLETLSTISPFIPAAANSPVIESVCFDLEADRATAVATDTRVLVTKSFAVEASGQATRCIMPAAAVKMARQILAKIKDNVTIGFDDKAGMLYTQEVTLSFRLVPGRYPDYRRVFPTEFTDHLTVSREEMIAGIRRAKVCGNENALVLITLTGDSMLAPLEVSAANLEYSTKAVQQVTGSYQGGGLEIGFNGDRLTDLLRAFPEGELLIRFNGDKRAALVTPAGEDTPKINGIIMPMSYFKKS